MFRCVFTVCPPRTRQRKMSDAEIRSTRFLPLGRRSHGLRSWDILTHEVLPSALLARKTAKNLKMTRKHELGVSTAFHVDWISPFLSRKASSRRDFPSCSRLFAVSRAISTHLNRFRLSVWYERASIGQGDFVGATKTPMPIQFLLLAAWK